MVATPSPLTELTEVVEAAASFRMDAEFDAGDGNTVKFRLFFGRNAQGPYWMRQTYEVADGVETFSPTSFPGGPGAAFAELVSFYPGAVLRPDSIKVTIRKGSTTAPKLVPVVEQAWHEAFGLPVPSQEDIAKRRKQGKEEKRAADRDLRLLLATGKAGVKAFNSRPQEERSRADLRKAVLTGFPLTGVDFSGVLLESADLSGAFLSGARFTRGRLAKAKFVAADLTRAVLTGSRCAEADFSRANLSRAEAKGTTFTRARFVDADLSEAALTDADLRGADFTGARLSGTAFDRAAFDGATKWPKGFKPPAELVWTGTGPDPRLALSPRQKARARPKDFAGFLDRLKFVADKAKLDKALGMLKADRFRLFARVEDDHLVGVVKSQSDASLVYSCRLAADGSYGCCTQNLNVCGGLRGSPCKHLLVLVVGLTQAGELDPGTAHDWVHSGRGRKPALDKDAMTETLLRFKGAEAGEVDWRPTETIPEDFYAI